MIKQRLALILILSFISITTYAQLKVAQYTLANGLTVYLNPDKTQTSITGAVAVNTGSKNDPESATGISHYLEHLLFKGTTELGTSNYEAEKVHLDSIYYLYDQLGNTSDDKEREAIQQRINKHSVEASKYAMPNEFDNLLKSIGSSKVNATTSNDLTIYFNTFPSHQAEKWLDIYTHRFQNPVFRSFQSELEVVYEEKNRAMDNLQRRIIEAYSTEFYKGHPYGDKTTLGTIEHLKNPSLNKMYAYYQKYYVANNMALILTGNFDPEELKPMIEKTFGQLEAGELVKEEIPKPRAFDGKEVMKTRITPIKVGFYGYRTVPAYHPDEAALSVASYLLQNEAGTGYIDELANKNKVMMAFSFSETMDEAGSQIFIVIPKIPFQSFKKVEGMLDAEIDKLKNGSFSPELLASVKNELYKDIQLSLEDPSYRIYLIADAYRGEMNFDELMERLLSIREVTTVDVQRVAKKYFGDDLFAFRSRTGFSKKEKLKKPAFEPLQIDQNQVSEYAKQFDKIQEGEPKSNFIDFKNDLEILPLGDSSKLFTVKNEINDIYTLDINFRKGTLSEPKLEAVEMLIERSFPKGMTMEAFKGKLGVLGSTITYTASSQNMTLTLTGIEQQLPELLSLINQLIQHPQMDENGIDVVKNAFKTLRKQEKLDGMLIARAMASYGLYGEKSTLKNRLSLEEIQAIDEQVFYETWKDLTAHAVSIHFSGKTDGNSLKQLIEENLALNYNGISEDEYSPEFIDRENNEVLLLDNKKLVQAHLFFIKKSSLIDHKNDASRNVFNQYYGGGFSGIITQEIREYRSLAYASSGAFESGLQPNPKGYFYTYIGTQADKTAAAALLSHDLMTNLPEKPERFELLKKNVMLTEQSGKPSFRTLSKEVEKYQLQGFDKDPSELAFKNYAELSFEDVLSFHKNYIKKYPTFLGIHGDAKQFNLRELEQIGKVRKIKREEVIRF